VVVPNYGWLLVVVPKYGWLCLILACCVSFWLAVAGCGWLCVLVYPDQDCPDVKTKRKREIDEIFVRVDERVENEKTNNKQARNLKFKERHQQQYQPETRKKVCPWKAKREI